MDDQKNQIHAPIYLDGTYATQIWPDRKLVWYFSVLEVIIDFVSGHFKSDGVVQPSVDFWIALSINFP